MTSDSASLTGWCEPHEQVRAARADEGMTKKTSPLHIPSFRWLPQRGGM